MMQKQCDDQRAAALAPLLAELSELEPIFHTRKFGTTLAQFEQRMTHDYWQVGASGRRYSRAAILEHLVRRPAQLADESGWRCTEHALRALGDDTYLFTYCLFQGERVSRRSTLWRRREGRWQVLYHHGSLVAD
jgi:hypothetical protein